MCNPVTTNNPDALLAKGVHKGLEWEVTHNGTGYRCGYVRVPAGHPWHGKDWEQVNVEVHGGLTFAEPDTDCGKDGEDNAWWLGFDAAHAGDAPDPALVDNPTRRQVYTDLARFSRGTARTTAYVEAECRRLADQAAAAATRVSAPRPDVAR